MKTKQQIGECIYHVLANTMALPESSSFHTDARLREDLAIDSSSILQLLVHLELEHGLRFPEEALMNHDLDTVRSIAKVLHDAQDRPNAGGLLEYDDDIKLHCFVSCLSEVVKRRPRLDHRPLYFGVWDSEIVVDDDLVISYHGETIDHRHFVDWYERLYGIEVRSWYDRASSREENVARLVSLVENRRPDEHVLVMLDMYRLPERVNEFNKDPFPHYLMLGTTSNSEEWMMYDPDYRWEGVVRKERVLDAMRQPSVAGGYVFSHEGARAPHPRDVRAYYEACIALGENPMTNTIRRVVTAYIAGHTPSGRELSLARLGDALAEIPILAIRKYAYEHGLAFFFRELELPDAEAEFDAWCEVIAELVKSYKVVQFQATRLAASGNRELATKLFTLLDEQDARESRIKRRLHEVFCLWRDETFPRAREAATGVSP